MKEALTRKDSTLCEGCGVDRNRDCCKRRCPYRAQAQLEDLIRSEALYCTTVGPMFGLPPADFAEAVSKVRRRYVCDLPS